MKEILIAKNAGFCFGVKRAIDKTEAVLDEKGEALICGSLIHNKSVTDDIVRRGGKIMRGSSFILTLRQRG